MTQLAVACALLEIPVDPIRLYESEDDLLMLWLSGVVDRVSSHNRAQANRTKASAR